MKEVIVYCYSNSLHASNYNNLLLCILTYLLDGVNNYVNVTFDHVTETITCVFLTEPLDSMKECDVILSYGAKCNTLIDIYEVSGRGDTLETPPLGFIEGIDQYCYEIIARHQNLNLNVTVEGIINLQRSSGTQQNGIINSILAIAILLEIFIMYCVCKHTPCMQ